MLDYQTPFEVYSKKTSEKARFVDYFENREYLASGGRGKKKWQTLKKIQQILTDSWGKLDGNKDASAFCGILYNH